jgi:hypothetical protein
MFRAGRPQQHAGRVRYPKKNKEQRTMNPLKELSQHNPLRGLTHSRLVMLLEHGEEGQYGELAWLYRFVEKRDPVVRAVKRRLLSALGKLDWSIKVVDQEGIDTGLADKQEKALRAAYDRIVNLPEALRFFSGLAELRGFAHLEKIYRGGTGTDAWDVTELRPVEQWFWLRDGVYGPWRYNATAREWASGTPIRREHWVIREVDDPADEIFARLYLTKSTNDKDWDGFLERYGIPSPFIEGPPNVPTEKEAEYRDTAEAIASDGGGYLPNGAKVHFASPPGSSVGVFRERLEYLDGQIVVAGTSGKLSILNEATGMGSGNAEVHERVFNDLADAIAMQASGEMQRQFDAPLLARLFPGQPVLAYFEYARQEEDDTRAHFEVAKLAYDAGLRVDAEELSERTGYKLSDALPAGYPVQNAGSLVQNDFPGKVIPTPQTGGGDAVAGKIAEGGAAVGEEVPGGTPATARGTRALPEARMQAAVEVHFAPVRERLVAILAMPEGAEQDAALREFRDGLPAMLLAISQDDTQVNAMEAALAAQLTTGAEA